MTDKARRIEILAEYLRSECAGNQAELARRLDRSPSQVNNMLAGKTAFGEKLARAIEELLEKPKGWLDGAYGGATLPGLHAFGSGGNVEPADLRARVPLISWVSAGDWCEAHDPFAPGDTDDWIETTARVSSRAYALKVRGDSMTRPLGSPSFPDGITIIVDPDRRAEHGSYVIARVGNGDAVFKRLSYDDGAIYLVALNPKYDPTKVENPHDLHICGVVVKGEFDV